METDDEQNPTVHIPKDHPTKATKISSPSSSKVKHIL
jgi:hypothetical protein